LELARGEVDQALPSQLTLVHVGRQAIYDASLSSRAYELFYRSALPRDGLSGDADRETCSVVLSAFAELGLARVASNKQVFLNVAHDVVSGVLPLPVSAELTVLQVRDYEHSAAELAPALAARRAEGYRVALDGFVLGPETSALLPVADYLKFNVRTLGPSGLARQLELVRGGPREIVACNIDTTEQFRACVDAGCHFFQGRFLFRPQVLSHKRLPKSLETVSLLLKRLRDPAVELAEVERIVKTDAALSLDVLGFFGSASLGLPRDIRSIQQAIGWIGLREFTKWVTLVALASTTQRPGELVLVALTRARASELLAQSVGVDADSAFTAGLMSMLEALFEQPLAELLLAMPVSAQISAAVLANEGTLGAVLGDVLSREREDVTAPTRFDAALVNRAWLGALRWAAEAQRYLR
jgi:EAL and modified HD-GYP domain-containing signal transduction protein